MDIALLRQHDPERLIVPGNKRVRRATWARHCAQTRDVVLVASYSIAGRTFAVGELQLHELAPCAHEGRVGMIDRLFVAPEHRRRGIGTWLIRAAITLARTNALGTLRESIPNVLRHDPGLPGWRPHTPTGSAFGGLRSLGATVRACDAEHQPCRVVASNRPWSRDSAPVAARVGYIGAILELPIVVPARDGCAHPATDPDLRTALLAALARHAGVSLGSMPIAPTV